jgi:hypothetical protein
VLEASSAVFPQLLDADALAHRAGLAGLEPSAEALHVEEVVAVRAEIGFSLQAD